MTKFKALEALHTVNITLLILYIMSLIRLSLLLGLFLNAAVLVTSGSNEALFPGRFLGDLDDNGSFHWFSRPVWATDGSYALLAFSKWLRDDNKGCGMMWRYNDTTANALFVECLGHFVPDNTGNAGLKWAGDENDLLVCQHETSCAF